MRNVQKIGGQVALIVNNIENVDPHNIIMTDDGQGRNLTIPGVLISKEDGEIIKDFYRKNKDVEMRATIKFQMVN